MNLIQLEYLIEMVKKGSFKEASKSLYVNPSTIAKAINSLEKELGVELLERNGRTIQPTKFTNTFVKKAQSIVSDAAELRLIAAAHTSKNSSVGRLNLGISTAYRRGSILTDKDFEQFRRAYPHIDLSISYYASETCISALKEGVVDAAIIMGDLLEPRFESRTLFPIYPQLALASSHSLAKKDTVHLLDLAHEITAMPTDLRCCYSTLRNAFNSIGINPTFISIDPSLLSHSQFIQQGGLIIVTETSPLTELIGNTVKVSLDRKNDFAVPICFACPAISKLSPVAALYEYLQKASPPLNSLAI